MPFALIFDKFSHFCFASLIMVALGIPLSTLQCAFLKVIETGRSLCGLGGFIGIVYIYIHLYILSLSCNYSSTSFRLPSDYLYKRPRKGGYP